MQSPIKGTASIHPPETRRMIHSPRFELSPVAALSLLTEVITGYRVSGVARAVVCRTQNVRAQRVETVNEMLEGLALQQGTLIFAE